MQLRTLQALNESKTGHIRDLERTIEAMHDDADALRARSRQLASQVRDCQQHYYIIRLWTTLFRLYHPSFNPHSVYLSNSMFMIGM